MGGRGRPARRHHRPPARRGFSTVRQALRLPPFVNDYRIWVVSPPSGGAFNNIVPEIQLHAQSRSGLPMDVQVEWRRQQAIEKNLGVWEPVPVYTVSQSGVASDVITPSVPPTELAYGTWWVRARAGNAATGTWSAWSAQTWFDVRPVLGSWTQYIDQNIGTTDPPLQSAFVYVEMNIGVAVDTLASKSTVPYLEMNVGVGPRILGLTAYTDLNVGPKFDPYVAMAYTDLNVDPSAVPEPHIWWIRPERGKEGYVFNIFGQGFGAHQNEYDGSIILGNLVCEANRWELIPSQLTATTVSVSGKPRTTSSEQQLPGVLLNSSGVIVEAGDIIEYDIRWAQPSGTQLNIFPSFTISGSAFKPGYNAFTMTDTDGAAWNSGANIADGDWHHRKFVVPPGHSLIGRTINEFRFAWYGFATSGSDREASLRSMVIRAADNTPKLWVMGDDRTSTPPLTYVANTGELQYATFEQEGFEIHRGLGLDPDVITPEHGWIVAVVPSGAVSSMVKVMLED